MLFMHKEEGMESMTKENLNLKETAKQVGHILRTVSILLSNLSLSTQAIILKIQETQRSWSQRKL